MPKKKPAKKAPKVAPFAMFARKEPVAYKISPGVQAILDDPSIDSEDLGLKDRAVLVLELGKRLVTEEDDAHHDDYLRHAGPLVDAGTKAYQWVYDEITEHLDEHISGCPYNWFPAIPFLFATDRDVVDDAARLVCIHHPGHPKDRLLGPGVVLRSLVDHLENGKDLEGEARRRFHVAIAYGVAAVLECGDLRLLPLLNEAWDGLNDEVRATLIERFGGRITELQVEFYLSILERTDQGDEAFELAAAHLSHCVQPRCMPMPRSEVTIDRIRFDFGLHKGLEEETVMAETPVAKHLAKIEPRLRALRPKAPSLIDDILRHWRAA